MTSVVRRKHYVWLPPVTQVWHRDVVIRVRPTELALGAPIAVGGSAGSATGPNGEFNYLETHQFVFAGHRTPSISSQISRN